MSAFLTGFVLALTVMRDAHPIEVTIVLRELLPVEATPPSRQEDQASQSPQEGR